MSKNCEFYDCEFVFILMCSIRIATYDPGWNDPPPMPTMTTQVNPVVGKPRTSLNKRVAFPMQSSAASSSNVKTTAEGLPLPFSTAKYQPAPMDSVPVPPPTTSAQSVLPPPPPSTIFSPSAPPLPTADATESAADAFEPSEARQCVQSVFSGLVEKMALTTDQNKLSEIRKRLEGLEQMWQENKLNESAQKNLYQLAKGKFLVQHFYFGMKSLKIHSFFISMFKLALENTDTAVAMEYHRTLVTQHSNVSTQWATALRQLILSLSPESEQADQNALDVLPETEVVQFVDVSSKPHVMDRVLSFPQEPLNVNANPIAVAPEPSIPQNENLNETANSDETTDQNASKSKFSRFGRILHI